MGLRILSGTIDGGDYAAACFYDSVTDWAFGPVFQGDAPDEQAQAFADWLRDDARTYTPGELEDLYGTWIKKRRQAGEDA